ncbi:hypothetical protein QVD17_24231 [Tagetes erecta]|uniref:Uncharacterized protein n=1 Tax=Tagetes erecta TaxID=13708 RepID=A0AAD8KLB6_TARER|nr:hypothetical protein QVD17_24231 [Tagetes erecta]
MSNKKTRGAAKCKEKSLKPDDFTIEFNANGIAIGENAAKFMSWIGVECRKKIPYNKLANQVGSKLYDEIWEYAKEISQKATASAKKNVDHAHVGRCGFAGLEPKVTERWNQLVISYPHLALIEDDRSKLYTVSRSVLNRVTNLYEIGPDKQSEGELKGTLKDLCRQQPKDWECGYCVMMAMYDFVIHNSERMLVNKLTMVRQRQIDEFVERTLEVFISSFGVNKDQEDG